MALSAESLLRGRNNIDVFAMTSGNIQKYKKDQVRSHAKEIIEVAADAFSPINSGNLRAIQRWDVDGSEPCS